MQGSTFFRIEDFVVYLHFDSVSPVSLDGWLEILMLGRDVAKTDSWEIYTRKLFIDQKSRLLKAVGG